jgi:hypothetical protein
MAAERVRATAERSLHQREDATITPLPLIPVVQRSV